MFVSKCFEIMSKVVKYTCRLRRFNYTHDQLNTKHYIIIFFEGGRIIQVCPRAPDTLATPLLIVPYNLHFAKLKSDYEKGFKRADVMGVVQHHAFFFIEIKAITQRKLKF